MAPYKIGGGKR